MANGALCRSSERFSAVTTTTSMPDVAAIAGVTPVNMDVVRSNCQSAGRPPAPFVMPHMNQPPLAKAQRAAPILQCNCCVNWSARTVPSMVVLLGKGRALVGGIILQHRAKRGRQNSQPRLEMAPLFDPLPEDRLAHLFGACGAHGTAVAIEVQTFLLERQAAIVEQGADFALGILDHAFIEDAVHASRQYGVEMRHQRDIVGVVAAELA